MLIILSAFLTLHIDTGTTASLTNGPLASTSPTPGADYNSTGQPGSQRTTLLRLPLPA